MSKKDKPEKYEDLSIYPLKIDTSKLNETAKYPLCNIPHLILVVGRVKAGKSVLVSNLYLSKRIYGDDFDVKILVSPSAHNDTMNQHLVKEFDYIFTEYTDSLLDELIEMVENDKSDDRYLIVFDDIIGTNAGSRRGKSDKLTSLSTMYRHIGNESKEGKLSICITTQYFKHITPILRNQCSGVYICGAFSPKELNKISEAYSFFGGSEKGFIELYKEARKNPYDFLFLNCHSMEARRNHKDLLWSYSNQFKKEDKPNIKMVIDKVEKPEDSKIIDETIKV